MSIEKESGRARMCERLSEVELAMEMHKLFTRNNNGVVVVMVENCVLILNKYKYKYQTQHHTYALHMHRVHRHMHMANSKWQMANG